MCLAGADTIVGPGALHRGGSFLSSWSAGVFAVFGNGYPHGTNDNIGFRCAR